MVINIYADGMELTPALRQYIEEKFNSLEKFAFKIMQVDVHVGRETKHQKGDVYTCSANVEIPGDLLKIERNAEDLYKAIDKVKDHLRETMSQLKARIIESRRQAE